MAISVYETLKDLIEIDESKLFKLILESYKECSFPITKKSKELEKLLGKVTLSLLENENLFLETINFFLGEVVKENVKEMIYYTKKEDIKTNEIEKVIKVIYKSICLSYFIQSYYQSTKDLIGNCNYLEFMHRIIIKIAKVYGIFFKTIDEKLHKSISKIKDSKKARNVEKEVDKALKNETLIYLRFQGISKEVRNAYFSELIL